MTAEKTDIDDVFLIIKIGFDKSDSFCAEATYTDRSTKSIHDMPEMVSAAITQMVDSFRYELGQGKKPTTITHIITTEEEWLK